MDPTEAEGREELKAQRSAGGKGKEEWRRGQRNLSMLISIQVSLNVMMLNMNLEIETCDRISKISTHTFIQLIEEADRALFQDLLSSSRPLTLYSPPFLS